MTTDTVGNGPPLPDRLIFVGPTRRYHASHSGYEALIRFLDQPSEEFRLLDAIDRGTSGVSSLLTENWRARFFRSIGLRWYGRRRLLEELSLAPTLAFSRRAIVHHLYAEESYRFGGYVPRLRGSRLVGTFHMPPSQFSRVVASPRHLRRLDAVIAVAREQAEFLVSVAGKDRVFYVPHGVDTDFFSPGEPGPEDFRCLFVGFWMRDVETLEQVVDRLLPEGIRFDLVTSRRMLALRGREGITVASNLAEEEFRAVYRRASCFLLPVVESSANNALLEAMACGLPVVATGIGGILDYCDPSHAILAPPRDAGALAAAVLRLRDDPRLRQRMALRSRERAVAEFDWKVIAKQVRAVYERVLS